MSNGAIIPMTHEIPPALHIGSVYEARLSQLASQWLRSTKAERLARACEEAWRDLAREDAPPAIYWYDAVAKFSKEPLCVPA
jgi:hypothetical protein